MTNGEPRDYREKRGECFELVRLRKKEARIPVVWRGGNDLKFWGGVQKEPNTSSRVLEKGHVALLRRWRPRGDKDAVEKMQKTRGRLQDLDSYSFKARAEFLTSKAE